MSVHASNGRRQRRLLGLPVIGFSARASAVNRELRSIAALNLELAKLEGRAKATTLGVAVGLAVLAVVLIFYAIGFAFTAAVAGFSHVVPVWLARLLVAGIIFLVAAICGFLALHFGRKAFPPQPAQAIQEAEETMKTLKDHA